MDRRSWLWRRKSSEKSPGETESSGSVSSLSERFSDDQACPTRSSRSPEVMSKVLPIDEEVNENVKALTEKLSTALLNISAKEDLVKQHAKVAEEAVSGWEKAENEVLTLKKQLEAAAQKYAALEDRAGHFDGALKECVRQLRQAREEQEQRIHEAVAKKTREWESTKSKLESKLVVLQKELQTAKIEAATSFDLDLCSKLETAEKENSALKYELRSQVAGLELRIMERDLSAKAAETASKQYLESIKKIAKLESECRMLKVMARKASLIGENKSLTASSNFVASFTDSQSDYGESPLAGETDNHKISGWETNECKANHSDSVTEIDRFKNQKALGRKSVDPFVEINLMDDFLEMERLAAVPDTEIGRVSLEVGPTSDQQNGDGSLIKAKLEAMIHRTAELEEKLQKMEAEKVDLEIALTESQRHLATSQNQLKESDLKLEELETQLVYVNKLKLDVEIEMQAANAARELAESQLRVVESEMETQLGLANKSRQAVEEELESAKIKREAVESQLRAVEAEMKTLHSKVFSLEEEIEKERAFTENFFANFQKSKDELLKMKHEAELRHGAKLRILASSDEQLKIKQEEELAVAASKFAQCQKTITSLGRQLRSLATIEDIDIDSEKLLDRNDDGKNGEELWKLHANEFTFVA